MIAAAAVAALAAACGGGGSAQEAERTPAPATAAPFPPDEPAAAPEGELLPEPREVGADELGRIPVLMYHRLREDGGGDFDRTPEEFRAELEWLFDNDYVPVLIRDLLDERIDIPAGTKPVVLTFDDSPLEHVQIDENGEVHPDTALGILEDVAADYGNVDPVAVWAILPDPFGGVPERGDRIMRELHERGHELANHTCSHEPLRGRSEEDVREDLACGAAIITDAVPDAEVRSFTLPLGVWPDEPSWIEEGTTAEGSYEHDAVLLVGSNPTLSPFHAEFEPLTIPRIRTGAWDGGEPDFQSEYWLDRLEETGTVYVSDGDPDTISFPADREADLADEYADRANPYDL